MKHKIVFNGGKDGETVHQWAKYNTAQQINYNWKKYGIKAGALYNWNKYELPADSQYYWNKYTIKKITTYPTWEQSISDFQYTYTWKKYNLNATPTTLYTWEKQDCVWSWDIFSTRQQDVYGLQYVRDNDDKFTPQAADTAITADFNVNGCLKLGTATFSSTPDTGIYGAFPFMLWGIDGSIDGNTGKLNTTVTSSNEASYRISQYITNGTLTSGHQSDGDFHNFAINDIIFFTREPFEPTNLAPIGTIEIVNDPTHKKLLSFVNNDQPILITGKEVNLVAVKTGDVTVDFYVYGDVTQYGITQKNTLISSGYVKDQYISTMVSTDSTALPQKEGLTNDNSRYYIYLGMSGRQTNPITYVTSTNPNAYPSGADSQKKYYYVLVSAVDYDVGNYKGIYLTTVTSTNSKAYPQNGILSGYYYEYQSKAKISNYMDIYGTPYYSDNSSLEFTYYQAPVLYFGKEPYEAVYWGPLEQMTDATFQDFKNQGYKYCFIKVNTSHPATGRYYFLSDESTFSLSLAATSRQKSYCYITNTIYQNYKESTTAEITLLYIGYQKQQSSSTLVQETTWSKIVSSKDKLISTIMDTSPTAYPKDGQLGNDWYIYDHAVISELGDPIDKVSSEDKSAYPDDGEQEGYWYKSLPATSKDFRGDYIENVTSTIANKYPQDGYANGFWYTYQDATTSYYATSYIDTITNVSKDAYPENGYSGGFWYIYKGEVPKPLYIITDAELIGDITCQQNINSQNDFVIGTAACASLVFNIMGTEASADKYKDLSCEFYIKQGLEEEWSLIGNFIINDIEENGDNTVKLSAYDNISLFDIYVDEFIETAQFPMTVEAFFSALCGYCGAPYKLETEINKDFLVQDNFTSLNTTGRQILQYVAQVMGGFAMAEPDGFITVKQYKLNPAINLNNTLYVSCKKAIYSTPKITKLTVQGSDGDLGVSSGTEGVTYQITNNPLLYTESESEIQTAVDNILNTIKNVSYVPMTIELQQDYGINCGDIVAIDNIETYIMSKSISNSGVVLESFGNKTRETVGDETNSEINALRGKINIFTRELEKTQSTLIDKTNNLQSQITQTASSISSIVFEQGKEITSIKQNLDGISLTYNSENGTASITIGDVTVRNLVNGEYVDEVVAGINIKGYVTFNDLKNAGSTIINGSNITTGTISADRLNLTGSIAWGDLSSATKAKIIEYAEDAAAGAADIPSYIHNTYIDSTNIYSPNIYGAKITAGSSSDGYIQMSSTGMNFKSNTGGSLIGMGYYPGKYNYPYFILGSGVDSAGTNRGMIKKFSGGIWIGDSDSISEGSNRPSSGTGLFVDFNGNRIYKVINGKYTQL